jgi:Na+/alanine symporter
MGDKKIKWLIYTVIVGMLPVLLRLFVWLVDNTKTVEPFSAADFVMFGLVLHISNINEIEHLPRLDKTWKTIQNGISIVFITIYSVFFTLTLLSGINPPLVDQMKINYCAAVLNVVSLFSSYTIYDKISLLSRSKRK